MGRMGVLEEEALAVFKEVSALPNIKVHSVSTHLPVSNEDEKFTREELRNFGKLIRQLLSEVPGDYKTHVLQTAGVLAFAEEPFEIVRPGMLINMPGRTISNGSSAKASTPAVCSTCAL